MTALAVAIACWALGAVAAFGLRRRAVAALLGTSGSVGGGVAAAVASLGPLTGAAPVAWSMRWAVPASALSLRIDALAAVYLLLVAAVGAVCAVYGMMYLRRQAPGRSIGGTIAAYNVLLLSMSIVVTANDIMLLIIAWEMMTLSSWALVVTDDNEPSVRTAGLRYLIASHLATGALVLLVLLEATGSKSFEIARLSAGGPAPRSLLFMLALIGFGTKAGIVPLHVWLPDAHPAAPSHVSAVMSAVMITMGFYGLMRFLPTFGEPALWWAYLLIGLGAAGAALGVAFALAQQDVKRALAYSTVEHAGIITLALGLAVLGTATHQPLIAGFAWMGALLHLWNHAVVKAALFLGFGAAVQGAGSRSLEMLGGLLGRWQSVGSALLVAAAAAAALPGLNVFASEWLIMRGLLVGGLSLHDLPQVVALASVVVLAFTGGLAVACFARLAGIGLLGAPRSDRAAQAPPPGWAMSLPILVLTAACILMAAAPAHVVRALHAAILGVAPAADVESPTIALQPVALLLPALLIATGLCLAVRAMRARAGAPRWDRTWGCGYPAPTARMQYTGASFAAPIVQVMDPVLRTERRRVREVATEGGWAWPVTDRWESRTADRALVALYEPLFGMIARGGARLRRGYRSSLTMSLVFIVATMLILLVLLFAPVTRP